MTKDELKKIMALVFAEHDIKITENRFTAWWETVQDVDPDTALKAAKRLLTQKTFGPPKIADFLESVADIRIIENPASQITESEAWGILLGAIQRFGWVNEELAMQWLLKQSPQIAHVVKNFGWVNICAWQNTDEVANRAHFWKCLASLKNRTEKFESLGITTFDTTQKGPAIVLDFFNKAVDTKPRTETKEPPTTI